MITSAPPPGVGTPPDPPGASKASGGDGAQLREAAEGFEALFLRQMLAAAREASFGNELFGSKGEETFREMFDARVAELAARQGSIGIADMLEAQLSRTVTKGNSNGL